MKRILLFLLLSAFIYAQNSDYDKYFSTNALDEDYMKNLTSESAKAALENAMTSGDDKVKLKVLDAFISLSKNGGKDIAPTLSQYLGYGFEYEVYGKDPTTSYAEKIRSKCAWALGVIYKGSANSDEGKQYCKRLTKILSLEKDTVVRKTIVYSLGEIKCTDIIPYFNTLLMTERDQSTIFSIVLALGNIGDKACLLPLLKIREGSYLPATKRAAHIAIQNLNIN